jgi:hypothetical protein
MMFDLGEGLLRVFGKALSFFFRFCASCPRCSCHRSTLACLISAVLTSHRERYLRLCVLSCRWLSCGAFNFSFYARYLTWSFFSSALFSYALTCKFFVHVRVVFLMSCNYAKSRTHFRGSATNGPTTFVSFTRC